jgi:pimeloyl-[acyl-carrier protein] methyl ester esterase
MSRIIFLPGFDGNAQLRRDFIDALGRRHEVRAASYPNRPLGSLDAYRVQAMGEAPVDWQPVLVAESFSGLVATRWASIDPRVQALVLCGSFARNPLGYATELGAAWPALVKLGPALMNPAAQLSREPARRRWASGFSRTMGELRNDVVAERLRLIATEDAGPALSALAIPVVVVHFDDDLVVGPGARSQLQAACARPHVVRLPGPHFALETRAAECAAAIDRALCAVLPRAA